MKKLILSMIVTLMLVSAASAYSAQCFDVTDTAPSAYNAYVDLNSMGYTGYYLTNCPIYMVYSTLSSSRIIFIDGHGLLAIRNGVSYIGGGIQTKEGHWLVGTIPDEPISGELRKIGGDNGINLNNLKLALYMACWSARTSDEYGNLAQLTASKGADISIGFTDEINLNKAKVWSDTFWESAKTKSVADSVIDARNAAFWSYIPYDWGLNTYVIYPNSYAANTNIYLN